MKKWETLFEDNEVMVVHKMAGLATQTAKVGQADLVSELKNHLARLSNHDNFAGAREKKAPYLGVIHRLDQPVEGLLVFAKTSKAAANLTKQLSGQESGTFHKQYLAVVCGKPAVTKAHLVDYLVKDSSGIAKVVSEDVSGAKKAVLQYCLIKTRETDEGQAYSIMDISIETGRFHQIRAQMAHAGMALLGDTKYGNETSANLSKELGVRSVALCANRLEFVHPVTGEKMKFSISPTAKIFEE